ncbi:hypothetical protein [Legionella oakridgensis]|uniref:Uncharacterized protein n=1 Tax=Legionella oakridgensis ATCC 33761 = DSM 21215 TaxID=1268635 RepID=W0BHI2_9GAMM|nr:hypothetical protein [Legionella oakridgensis]AHE68092.1 hypothetical protein Loa_02555 [Legionella oakridgensis ATCC 33761 = DSM 21215]
MDLFIAEDRARNKGLGVQMIQQFIGEFLTKFQAIIVDRKPIMHKPYVAMRKWILSGLNLAKMKIICNSPRHPECSEGSPATGTY